MNYLRRNLIGGDVFEIVNLIVDRMLFISFYKFYYKKIFKHYGDNIRWGRNFRRFVIPSTVRISCPEKISIFNNVQIDDGVYLQCHQEGEGIILDENVRINAHTHLLSYDLISLGREVLIAPFCLISSGNHTANENLSYMRSPMRPSGRIYIESGTWLGQGAVILGNTTIGKNSVIGARTTVKGNFESCSKLTGNSIRSRA